jgi:hypothetical protein
MDQKITIKLQPSLGFMRTFNLTVNGIRYRIFRSVVTMIVISVAIAFMMNVVVENIIKSAMVDRAIYRLEELRVEALWTARLVAPSSRRVTLMHWATGNPESLLVREGAGFAGMSSEEQSFLLARAPGMWDFLLFVEGLDYGQQRLLLDGHDDVRVFSYLADPANFARFEAALATVRGMRLPLTIEELKALIQDLPAIDGLFARIHAGHTEAIGKVRAGLAGQTVEQALREVDGRFGDVLRDAGFALEPDDARALAENARASAVALAVEQALGDPRLRQSLAARENLMPQEVGPADLWRQCLSEGGARWVSERLIEFALLDTDRGGLEHALRFIARRQHEENRLIRVERMGFEVGERMFWLILLSLIVCIVGITNAMLMSVTERYREIATFKCLGALDGSIMLIFVIEASLLGMVGGLIGAVTGALLGFGTMTFRFGDLAFRGIPFVSLWMAIFFSVLAGIVLAALAAVYPSLKAARLAPMEAMRIE